MPRKLPAIDIRARRRHLVNDDFALAEGPEFEPRGNISSDVWHGIVNLPDDVLIRTTDFQATDVERAHALLISWLDTIDSLPEDCPLYIQALAVYEAFDASLFNAVNGWYRTAGLALRAAVDDLLVGLYFQIIGDRAEFDAIVSGKNGSPRFRNMRDAVLAATKDHALFAYPGGSFGQLYDTLSIYTHRISHGELWDGSNGPIYVKEGFDRWFKEYVQADEVLKAAVDAGRAFT